MILTGKKIASEIKQNKITIYPFNRNQLISNSYTLRLSDTLLKYKSKIIDPKVDNEFEYIKIQDEGFLIRKNEFYLGSSLETIGSDFYAPLIHGTKEVAKMGLFIHITADLIDIGFHGKTTYQFYATQDVIVYPSQEIAQVSFWAPLGEVDLYTGKYMGTDLPTSSKIFKDFEE